ncbi:hypothetical protein, partial [Thalassospira sp.]|uniref:hypothetical protein n=1 Tax=Thalassospira sp. TaxID=1912094 RepID=UPI0032EE3259
MRAALVLLAVVLIGLGGLRLGTEMTAMMALPDVRTGFANGDGFEDEARKHQWAQSIANGDADLVLRAAKDQLQSKPFDPVLLSLIAGVEVMRANGDLQISASLFDQAMAIAPYDQRVRNLRHAVQARLQT